jgi:hypothetical protein
VVVLPAREAGNEGITDTVGHAPTWTLGSGAAGLFAGTAQHRPSAMEGFMSVSGSRLRVLLCGLLAVAGCTMHGAPATHRRHTVQTVSIVVDNRELADLQIFLLRDGAQLPVGYVEGMTRRSLRIPAVGPLTTQFALMAATRSSLEGLRSPTIIVAPGQSISWRLDRASQGANVIVE